MGTPTPLIRIGGSAGSGASRRSRAAVQEQDLQEARPFHFSVVVRLPWVPFLLFMFA